MNNLNFEKEIWDCKNYRNHMDKGYNFFKWLEEIINDKDLKIKRQKKKKFNLKNEMVYIIGWLKMSTVLRVFSLWVSLCILNWFIVRKFDVTMCYIILRVMYLKLMILSKNYVGLLSRVDYVFEENETLIS